LPPVQRQFSTTYGVDDDSSRIRRILHGKPQLNIHGHIAEEFAFHPNKTDFIVFLPRHIITGANMDIVVDQPLGGNGLNGFRFGFFLRGQAMSVEHIEKISVAAGIELVSPFQLDTTLLEQVGQYAVGNGRPNLRLDVITDNRNILCLKTLGPYGIAGNLLINATLASNAQSA